MRAPGDAVSDDLGPILRLRVPLIVRLSERKMKLREVLALAPGAIIELPKHADDPLDLLVNNVRIGGGSVVKVGENFGLRLEWIGDQASRVQAMGPSPGNDDEDDEEDRIALQLLGGQA